MHNFSISLMLLVMAASVSAHKQCMMPDRNTGKCRPLKKCKPLLEFNRKRHKTNDDLLYISQSSSSCGTASLTPQVCCPPKQLWGSLTSFRPIVYDDINEGPTLGENKSNSINQGGRNARTDAEQNKKILESRSSIPKYECGRDNSNNDRIIGGSIADIDQFPWLVLLEYDNSRTLCGGSLITTRYVLTAAHCIRGCTRCTEPKFARLAEYNTTSGPTDWVYGDPITVDRVPIVKNIAHPNFTYTNLHHDIGLSKLARDAVLSGEDKNNRIIKRVLVPEFIRLICLPDQDLMKSFRGPMEFTVAGWGIDGHRPSEVKKYVKVPFVAPHICRRIYWHRSMLVSQMCAGGNLDEDSCRGDSGGPLMYERNSVFVAVGIVSYGQVPCGTVNIPGVYTYVYPYLDWLRENMI